jgi:hypothetical protein
MFTSLLTEPWKIAGVIDQGIPQKPLCDERPRSGGVFCFLREFLEAFQAALSRRLLSWPKTFD